LKEKKMSKWAIVTGASSGIGAAFLPLLAEKGYSLVLVARREERLNQLKDDLSKAFPQINVKVHSLDLTDREASAKLLEAIGGDIDVLVNNAGYGKAGEAAKIDSELQLKMIDLNVRSLTDLTLTYVPHMVKRGHGTVLNVGSIVGFLPVPYMSVYAATKAYVLSFSEGLDHELRGSGVRVQVLCPGSTDSEFHKVAEEGGAAVTQPKAMLMSSKDVACIGVNMIDRGSTTQVAGFMNRVVSLVPRFLPRKLMTYLSGRLTPAAPQS
jgi:uncharacterized protein